MKKGSNYNLKIFFEIPFCIYTERTVLVNANIISLVSSNIVVIITRWLTNTEPLPFSFTKQHRMDADYLFSKWNYAGSLIASIN